MRQYSTRIIVIIGLVVIAIGSFTALAFIVTDDIPGSAPLMTISYERKELATSTKEEIKDSVPIKEPLKNKPSASTTIQAVPAKVATKKVTPAPPKVPVPSVPIVPVAPVEIPVIIEEGPTTLSVSSVPLLWGGTASAGSSVAISYLKVVNIGKASTTLKGFLLQQNGSAPGEAVIGLSTVDDNGEPRGLSGGKEGSTPFKKGVAYAPAHAVFAPGQMRLFTIKAIMSNNLSAYVGTQLKIDVTGVDANATINGSFPMRGTTWTLGG